MAYGTVRRALHFGIRRAFNRLTQIRQGLLVNCNEIMGGESAAVSGGQ